MLVRGATCSLNASVSIQVGIQLLKFTTSWSGPRRCTSQRAARRTYIAIQKLKLQTGKEAECLQLDLSSPVSVRDAADGFLN
ncbi:hypothetical protein WOLCODRAFT_61236 [Wolfiporia cocos MD-104 SS10]|uniref:Uncharacterized protein n=1 Tax=Wolfiporia cocos (strain MD-104) TaxID=742152 RepID=A0A2H3ITJ4_WOLCO|nr:hypothetical protein WOLCODRAFT_61236 [Wolfiporia cocos MD-104 SS10]